jgi:hypothetical protein
MNHILSSISGAHILLICIWILSAVTSWVIKKESPLGVAVGITVLYGFYKFFMITSGR